MKKSDKVMYSIIKIIGIIAIVLISYFIIFSIMHLMNTTEYSKILIDMNIYKTFYTILNFVSQIAIPILLIMFLIAIPYFIVFLIISVFFIRKYVKYNGEKKKQMIKIIILCILTICFVIKGVSLMPLTTKYKVNVNAKVNEVSNLEIKEFLKEEITGNKYIYKIEITQGFPDDYNVNIFYQDTTKKVEKAFLSDYNYDFIIRNAKNITNELTIKSIIVTLIGDILCIYFLLYVLKEFKRISIINAESSI